MNPICNATSALVRSQTFSMRNYQTQKDKLQQEAMRRNPENALLVANEEFDKEIDGLG